jgi:hypothetical protein
LPVPFEDFLEPLLWSPVVSPSVLGEALRLSMVAVCGPSFRFVAAASPAPPNTRTGSPVEDPCGPDLVVPPSGTTEGADDCVPRATSAPSRADAKDCAEPASDAFRAASEAAAGSPDKERENDCIRKAAR